MVIVSADSRTLDRREDAEGARAERTTAEKAEGSAVAWYWVPKSMPMPRSTTVMEVVAIIVIGGCKDRTGSCCSRIYVGVACRGIACCVVGFKHLSGSNFATATGIKK
jgi:hypothetical protein